MYSTNCTNQINSVTYITNIKDVATTFLGTSVLYQSLKPVTNGKRLFTSFHSLQVDSVVVSYVRKVQLVHLLKKQLFILNTNKHCTQFNSPGRPSAWHLTSMQHCNTESNGMHTSLHILSNSNKLHSIRRTHQRFI